MSKKMMKRSLALGALMAFVITGSAMAAEVQLGTTEYPVDESGIHTLEDNIYKDGNDADNNQYDGKWDFNHNIEYLNANLNGKELYIVCDNTGAVVSGKVSIKDTNGGDLRIENTGDGQGLRPWDGTEIDVDELTIITTNSNAIYQTEGNKEATVNIYANKIVIDAGYNAIQAYGNLNIGTKDKRAGLLEITAQNKMLNSGGAVNIYVDTLNVSGVNKDEDSEVLSGGSLLINALRGEVETGFKTAGELEVTFGGGVNWTGGVVTTDNDGASSTLTLNGATWNVTKDSSVTKLAGNGGIIAVQKVEDKLATVTVTNEKTATDLTVKQAGVTADYFTTEEDKKEQLNALAKAVVNGEGESVADVVAIAEGDISGAVTAAVKNGEVLTNTIKKAVAQKNENISDAGMNLKAHWRAHMNDMNKRMGDLRMANGETGVWTRMVRGESEYDGSKVQYNQYQLGYDEKLSVDKRWTVGAAVTFSEGDGSYGSGSTDDKSTAFAIYGSKLNNDGTFIDLIARYARLESDLEDIHSGNGDYETNGYSVSAEFGKRIEQGNGLWIEPQVELTYGTVDSADFVLNRTSKEVHIDSMDSFVARAGFALGKNIKQGNVYARASYLYDFDGETETSFSNNGAKGDVVKEDFGGGWWEVGVGANINLSKATYIYADVEKTFGGEVDTKWQWNLGVRYSF